MTRRFSRFACVDWSGARGERLKGIAVAECSRGGATPISIGAPDGGAWSRQAILDWLLARADANLLVGLDFSFALPFADHGSYFPGMPRAPASARELWRAVDATGGDHLAAGGMLREPALAAHFRIGTTTGTRFDRGGRNGRLRRTEMHAVSGQATSSFNLVGAGQVGKASLAGMRVLHRLAGRVPVWPFDPVPGRGALIVEVYTSIAARAAGRPAGRSKMTSWETLDLALTHPAIGSAPTGLTGPVDDHRSDAILTAAWLRRAAVDATLWQPPPREIARTEGWTFGVPCSKEPHGPA